MEYVCVWIFRCWCERKRSNNCFYYEQWNIQHPLLSVVKVLIFLFIALTTHWRVHKYHTSHEICVRCAAVRAYISRLLIDVCRWKMLALVVGMIRPQLQKCEFVQEMNFVTLRSFKMKLLTSNMIVLVSTGDRMQYECKCEMCFHLCVSSLPHIQRSIKARRIFNWVQFVNSRWFGILWMQGR